jgi:hypothetical protein
MRLTTIKDDLAIARDWRSPVIMLSELMRIDTGGEREVSTAFR